MDLFEVIPNNLFTILTSKNRSIYADSLMIINKAFKENVLIDKEVLTAQLINELHNNIYDIDVSAETSNEAIIAAYKDATGLARYIIKKLSETGWIDIEYESTNHLVEYVSLPPYSIRFIKIISDLTNNEVKEYDSFMYAMYSSLLNADQNYKDYRYTALNAVYEKMMEFEDSLKTLFHNLKRRYTNLVSLKTVNQILTEHFDSYQKDVIMQIYLPLKTKDSITRFKGSVFGILSKWMRDEQTIENMAAQAIVQAKYKDIDDAKNNILTKLNYIVDKLNDLEELVDLIDKRNTSYVSAATEKMHHLLNNDKSISGKLAKVMTKLAYEIEQGYDKALETCEDVITLQRQNTLSEMSLYNRAQKDKSLDSSDPHQITYVDENIVNKLKETFSEATNNKYSNREIVNYMKQQFEGKELVNSQDIKLENGEDLVMLILSYIKAYDKNIFYRVSVNEGKIQNGHYEIPNLDFSKRRG